MFTPGGQLDLHTFAGVRGSKGGGNDNSQFASRPVVLTDPVNGKSFVQETNPYLFFQNQPGQKSAQEQLNEEIAQRQAQEQADSLAKQQQATTDAANKETAFQGSRQTAYNDALNSIMHQFSLQGVDPTPFLESDIKPALQRQFNSIQDLDPNPAAAFGPTLGSDIINNIISGKRTQASSALNKTFTPTFATDLIPDTTPDSFIQSILSEQFDPLSTQLQAEQKRGTLNPTGFQAASDLLGQKRTAAESNLRNLGNTILESDRGDINNIVGSAKTAASGLGLTDTFDPTSFTTQAQSKAASDIASFGGALRDALGDTKFVGLQDLLNAGGSAQGVGAPTVTNPNGVITNASPFAVDPTEEANRKRGLGSTGAF